MSVTADQASRVPSLSGFLRRHGISLVLLALVLLALMAFLLLRRLRLRLISTRPADDSGLVLKVEGMTCQHCVANVRHAVEGVGDVEQVSADLDSGRVWIRGKHLDPEPFVAAIVRAGYTVVDE